MQRLSAPLHGTLSSYLRDAFQEGSADAVAFLFFGLRFFPLSFFYLLINFLISIIVFRLLP
jgi:hypothetical protein